MVGIRINGQSCGTGQEHLHQAMTRPWATLGPLYDYLGRTFVEDG